MRTIRTKLYKFDELTPVNQIKAMQYEALRFVKAFNIRWNGFFTENELIAAKERIIKYKYEFTYDGKMI